VRGGELWANVWDKIEVSKEAREDQNVCIFVVKYE